MTFTPHGLGTRRTVLERRATRDTRALPVGHELGASDLDAAKSWLETQIAN